MRLRSKNARCHWLTTSVTSEADGTRTRNLRIDSPAIEFKQLPTTQRLGTVVNRGLHYSLH